MNELAVDANVSDVSFGMGWELSPAAPSHTPVIEPLPWAPV
jgi:hypothetical protein